MCETSTKGLARSLAQRHQTALGALVVVSLAPGYASKREDAVGGEAGALLILVRSRLYQRR